MASSGPAAPDSLPLRPAITKGGTDEDFESPKMGPKAGKAVSIAEPESISPLIQPLDSQTKKQFTAGVAKRLSGRPRPPSSHGSIKSEKSVEDLPAAAMDESPASGHKPAQRHHHHSKHDRFLSQVAEWLQAEKAKRAARKAKKQNTSTATIPDEIGSVALRPSSQGSDSSALSLEKLQTILENNMSEFIPSPSASPMLGSRRPSNTSRRSFSKTLMRTASSDTEYHDGDVIVPTCDVVLDNSKTLSYTGGAISSASDVNLVDTSKKAEKERKAWSIFKEEILKLAHTLRLKGWRRIPLDRGDDIEVERLSGALTNAVYVVSPPKKASLQIPSSESGTMSRTAPSKVLLRIYGPQVEHLIDRENELSILRRLARKKIGPRLLGTFLNGRFEEYLESITLTSADLRVLDTSKQIAKRMRELHDGIDLLPKEREGGPFVWKNWDKWVERCEFVIKFLDSQILSGKAGPPGSKAEARGLVCGVEWPVFRAVIDKYRKFVEEQYGGAAGVRKQLVFAHNDTQYGNILRLKPTGESPLLLPSNSHKQLVVIDFEYASANTPGLEFANHFTEWCYNYHDAVAPHACNTHDYPTQEEQRRFIRSYVNHRPQFNPRASATPKSTPASGPGNSVSEFLLDSRSPGGGGTAALQSRYAEEEAAREKQTDQSVEELMQEARLWRIANSAQWVAWGIVQAQVPELDALEQGKSQSQSQESSSPEPMSDKLSAEVKEKRESHDHDKRPEGLVAETLRDGGDRAAAAKAEAAAAEAEGEEEFDYLGYAHERALFFWGDVVQLGIVKKDDLPRQLTAKLKVVPY